MAEKRKTAKRPSKDAKAPVYTVQDMEYALVSEHTASAILLDKAVDGARANAIIWTSFVWFALIVLAVAFKGF